MRLGSLLVVLLLSGCATTPPAIVYKDKLVPVFISCVENTPEKPDYATYTLNEESTIGEITDAYLMRLVQMSGYIVELEGVVNICASAGE